MSRDFLYFFHELNPSGFLINSQKLFCWKIRFREDIHEKRYSAKSENWNVRKSKIGYHCTESDSAQCYTAQSQTICLDFLKLQFSGLLGFTECDDISKKCENISKIQIWLTLRRVRLRAVLSAQAYIARSQQLKFTADPKALYCAECYTAQTQSPTTLHGVLPRAFLSLQAFPCPDWES